MKGRIAMLVTTAALATACSSAGGASVARGPAVTAPGPAISYVAVGASETVGYGATNPLTDAWPQVLFHTAFPSSATFTNLGIPGETVSGALTDEVPEALKLHPNVVTVWLNVNDALAGVLPPTYQAQLTQLVQRLRDGGKTKVLVANTPPVDQLPAYLACIHPGSVPGQRCQVRDPSVLPQPSAAVAYVAAYNAAIAAVCQQQGATLVDLHAVGERAVSQGRFAAFIGRDGFHPSTEGHQEVAAAFATAVRSLGIEPTPAASRTPG